MTPKRRKRGGYEPLPVIPVESVLTELGAESVPTGFGWVRMACPLHEDRTPSAAVNHDINAFTCHSCGVHGDSLKLLQNEFGLSFREALDKGRLLAGIQPGSSVKPRKTRRPSDLLKGGL
jgi:hypothetical protein